MERWNTILSSLYPVGSIPGILYGRAKIHISVKDGIPSFQTILSAIGTPTYKLSTFFVPLLTPLTLNEYTIKDSFSFTEELLNYDSNLIMASFDVESLFTNILLQETIELFVKLLFNDKSNINESSQEFINCILSIKTKLLFTVKSMYFSNPFGMTLTFTSNLPISFIIK